MSAADATRRRLMFIFSTSVVTTVVSLVHAALIFEDAGIKVVIAAMVENAVSLMVCNVPVLATAVLRRMGSTRDDDADTSAGTRLGTFLRFRTMKSRGTAATTVGITLTGRSTVTEGSVDAEHDHERTKDGAGGLGTRTEYRDAKVTWGER